MNNRRSGESVSAVLLMVAAHAIVPFAAPKARAQNPQLQQRLVEIKQAVAVNKQSLARYRWQELQTVIINGEVKKQQLFQVRVGPDGKPEKALLRSSPPSNSPGGPVRQRIVEKKTAEYEQYAQQIAALAQSYAQPDPQPLETMTSPLRDGWRVLNSGLGLWTRDIKRGKLKAWRGNAQRECRDPWRLRKTIRLLGQRRRESSLWWLGEEDSSPVYAISVQVQVSQENRSLSL